MNAEAKYISGCYGIVADSPMHTMTKGETVLRFVFTNEIESLLADGWLYVGKTTLPSRSIE